LIIPFVKMSGAGNDMILVDHREPFLGDRLHAFVTSVCRRRSGVGADGVILVEKNEEPDCPLRIRFFNPDGSEYGLCGNGARCVPLFAAELGYAGPTLRFRSPCGIHDARRLANGRVRLSLPPVRDLRLDVEAQVAGEAVHLDFGRISDPHAALWVEDVATVPVELWGPELRRAPAFGPDGTNISFVQTVGRDRLKIRTFERGVEGETLACGSGSTVIAAIARRRGLVGSSVLLDVSSGDQLRVDLPGQPDESPVLEGPAARCFEGKFELPQEAR
jgi:diaminopimelate epimerase